LYHCSADFFIEGAVKDVVLGFQGGWIFEGVEQGPKLGSMRVEQGDTFFHPRLYMLFRREVGEGFLIVRPHAGYR
jgi:hypothetical protein